jgi:hypothetical protein
MTAYNHWADALTLRRRSRVDLARIALEHARPEAAQTP